MPFGLQRYTRQILKIIIPAFLALYAVSCATIVSPSGGPKDITPPKMLSSQPRNFSTNFNGNKLALTFDEFVELKTPEKYLLISPPLKKMPDIKVKGHSVVIKLADTLRSNTTYNFYFGDAVVDITENNPLSNFNFAFSTGPDIDSLSLMGNVTDAFTRMPVKDAIVMLYSSFEDSVPMKQIPMYVSRTAENGDFRLNSLASGKYRAVALLDGNSDYMYDLPTETIGFSSDSVQPYYSPASPTDTNAAKQTNLGKQLLISINLFPEPDSTQKILKSAMAARNRLTMAFRYPTSAPSFRALNVPDTMLWSVREWNRTNDTLNAWLLDKPDTLKLEVTDHGRILDTLKISTALKTTGKTKNTTSQPRLRFTASASSGFIGYNKPMILTFANPVKEFDLKALRLEKKTSLDTTFVVPAAHFTDSLHRRLLVEYNWNAKDGYDLYVPKSSFVDIYSDSCDSTHVAFSMRPIEEYGTLALLVNRSDVSFPVIIQLLSEKGVVLAQQTITTAKRIDFGLLEPGKYGLKAIMDANANGKWDTGVLKKKIQPERVLVHPKIFEVRTNWELEENWDL
ncbi:MAG: Ig-like domain-containing protein [Bacteroidota bacterium]